MSEDLILKKLDEIMRQVHHEIISLDEAERQLRELLAEVAIEHHRRIAKLYIIGPTPFNEIRQRFGLAPKEGTK